MPLEELDPEDADKVVHVLFSTESLEDGQTAYADPSSSKVSKNLIGKFAFRQNLTSVLFSVSKVCGKFARFFTISPKFVTSFAGIVRGFGGSFIELC